MLPELKFGSAAKTTRFVKSGRALEMSLLEAQFARFLRLQSTDKGAGGEVVRGKKRIYLL